MIRAYYQAPIHQFLSENPLKIFGELANCHPFDLEDQQKQAWNAQIYLLQSLLTGIDGQIYFEFSIPRMGKRVDVILLIQGIVFVLEFKIGEHNYSALALDQVMDYALDLKNFHATSHNIPIIPILVATYAKATEIQLIPYQDQVFHSLKVNASTLGGCLKTCLQTISSIPILPDVWETGQYKPTPTIIEAAQALYRGHNVHDISRSDSGATNLSLTSDAIDQIIARSQKTHQKVICFITGVPGAGKTLAGLDIANRRLQMGNDEHAVFLSGNGPLVIVLREALVRDERESNRLSRKDSYRKAQTFIQNIHLFRDEYVQNTLAPLERVIIFDEAQRAWTEDKAADFMKRKRGLLNFTMSEPEFLISVMDRHADWAVIICLVGGGQEINTGEAGLKEWFRAVEKHFPHWHVYVSENLADSEYLAGQTIPDLLPPDQFTVDNRLHLAVSVRSFRSEKVSALVKAILDLDLPNAQALYARVSPHYPIFLTRDLQLARRWLLAHARGTERYGLLASSGAVRLRPEGLFIKSDIDVAHWFLDAKQDVRSSYALEEVATEFDIQGLELDWTAVAWDADLRLIGDTWDYKAFLGSKWQTVKKLERQQYLKNSYRVLLTRARQGMIIYIPRGAESDPTRLPAFYDGTYSYLEQIGLPSFDP